MKKKIITLILVLTIGVAESFSQTTVLDPGPFDGGRVRTNTAIDFHSFGQWISGNDNPGNVGFNEEGIWWAFLRFPAISGDSQLGNPELFNLLNNASSVTLDIAVWYYELNPALIGLTEEGVTVSFYLVPDFNIPDGELPTFGNSWIYSYPNAIKFAEIAPGGTKTVFPERGDRSFATQEERLTAKESYEFASVFQKAVTDGLINENSTWGIVFYSEESEPLTPNDTKWVERRQTLLDLGNATLTIDEAPSETELWGGYTVDENDIVNTESWLGFLNLTYKPYVWNYALAKWMYIEEPAEDASGAWAYIIK